MLSKFEVKNFKGFEDWFVIDFSETKDYQFNTECINNAVINKAIIYGANGSGKSNLGYAIFDIISHLTDKRHDTGCYINYLNANRDTELAEFKYTFKFKDNHIVEYSYGKLDKSTLSYEILKINNELVVSFDRRMTTKAEINLEGAENLNTDIGDSKISVINYIKNNTILINNTVNEIFTQFVEFIDGMLFFRSLDDNSYLGFEVGSGKVGEDIIKHDNLADFQDFLNQAGVECKLTTIEYKGEKTLAFKFNKKVIYFYEVASTGTKSLALFYYWYQRLKEDFKVTFVFVDEFDAFYHHALSRLIVSRLKEISAQVIITTHNTSVMTNDLLRPDCYFLMDKEKIKPVSQCTEKELRVAHNLEKMYKAGSFNAG